MRVYCKNGFCVATDTATAKKSTFFMPAPFDQMDGRARGLAPDPSGHRAGLVLEGRDDRPTAGGRAQDDGHRQAPQHPPTHRAGLHPV